jgi:methyl-accepting chemotaxis protein
MHWLSDRRLKDKLTVAFVTLLVFAGSLGAVSLSQLKRLSTINNDMKSHCLPSVKLGHLTTNISEFRLLETQHMLAFDPTEKLQIETVIKNRLEQLRRTRAEYAARTTVADERQRLAHFDDEWTVFMTTHLELLGLSRLNQVVPSRTVLRGKSEQAFAEVLTAVSSLEQLEEQLSSKMNSEAEAVYRSGALGDRGAAHAGGARRLRARVRHHP